MGLGGIIPGGNLLALRVVILDQVLEEVHSLLGLNLVDFDQVLQSNDRRAEVKRGEEEDVTPSLCLKVLNSTNLSEIH